MSYFFFSLTKELSKISISRKILPLETIPKNASVSVPSDVDSFFFNNLEVNVRTCNHLYCFKKCIMLLLYPQIEVDTMRRHGQILYDDVTARAPFSVVLTLLLCQGCRTWVHKKFCARIHRQPDLIYLLRRKYSCTPNRHILEFLPGPETKRVGKFFKFNCKIFRA